MIDPDQQQAPAVRAAGAALNLPKEINKMAHPYLTDAAAGPIALAPVTEKSIAYTKERRQRELAEAEKLEGVIAYHEREAAAARALLADVRDSIARAEQKIALVEPLTEFPPQLTGDVRSPSDTDDCPVCGDLMVWDRQQNGFVHVLETGGFEVAGQSCRRPRKPDTKVMDPVGDDSERGLS
ncbi:hypothetical protein [Microbispora sp. CA-102843]|uniref:hypothetical protein n=1 Tax=Microbispora sp. CA-102843 TaxID=3239952 RepID=UPI003D91F61E